jgi:nucleotide-binding universal stress UspA family protein
LDENPSRCRRDAGARADRKFSSVGKVAAGAAGVPCETVNAQSSSPYEEIINAAKKSGCDAIFVASQGHRGLGKLFVGSETQKVLAYPSIPVLVVR